MSIKRYKSELPDKTTPTMQDLSNVNVDKLIILIGEPLGKLINVDKEKAFFIAVIVFLAILSSIAGFISLIVPLLSVGIIVYAVFRLKLLNNIVSPTTASPTTASPTTGA
tara:strand:+ start:11 stop:340 length:330 start_codon:yes stop_codon:yes gene_type:complete